MASSGGGVRSFLPSARAGLGCEPAGLYVHVPFCSAVCPYCDFAVARAGEGDSSRYLRALLREIGLWRAPGALFDTIYLGGGTPSLLTAEELRCLFEALRDRFALTGDARLSIEVNPEDVDERAVNAWRELGVHTVSLGVQAFDDAHLRRLGRRHRSQQAARSVELVVAAGFDVVSVDLIYGLPDQSRSAWGEALDLAVGLGARHLSCYELTVHEGTPFWRWRQRGGLRLPGESARADWFLDTHRRLGALGWSGYEVSSFAASRGSRSRHNQKYWRHVPYLGLGPSAHSFDGRRRWWNVRSWKEWSAAVDAGDVVEAEEDLDAEALALEALMLGLRTSDGVDLERFRELCGHDLESERSTEIAELERTGLVESTEGCLRPTLSGMAIAESLALRLASDVLRSTPPAGAGNR
ncbi:MAG TPA: radical SAM family heme chaperone HemW [Thermoanaerobaculia bacterium]|nr:radical SAM family heme chaperone HemW [Thermoanaerobaculia bacterium]